MRLFANLDRVLALILAMTVVAFAFAGCALRQPVPVSETITVEGQVTARGHEPFSAYVLETKEGNLYVLDLPADEGFSTPSRMRVSGRLYAAEWHGRLFAHIEVRESEQVR